MTLRVVGAGLPRTGTTSLKTALEQLLGAPCYHMRTLAEHQEHAPIWVEALSGAPTDWDTLLDGYAAGVDWPFSCMWRELSGLYPDAIVLLSRRASADEWYASADATVLRGARWSAEDADRHTPPWMDQATPEQVHAMREMWRYMGGDLLTDPFDADRIKAGYERHLVEVRAEIPAARLVEWQPGDGWEPLCAALGVPVPDEPFPHMNTREEMLAHLQEAGVDTDE